MKEKILVQDFCKEYVEKRIENTKYQPDAIETFIQDRLDIVRYLPFNKKREIVEIIVSKAVTEEDGVKRADGIAQFLAFIVAMVASHTTLAFSDKPEEDYDALSRCGVLEHIIAMFKKDVDECDVLLKMAIADELADNNLNVIIGKFLNGVLGKMDGLVDIMAKGFTENLDLSKLLGANIKEEDVAKILGLGR